MNLTTLSIKMQYIIKERKNAMKKLRGSMTEIFSVGLQKTDIQGPEGLTECITM